MALPPRTRKLELKSASDFEQWLNEINLFAQEMQTELHEIAGMLSVALSSGYATPPRPSAAYKTEPGQTMSPLASSVDPTDDSAGESLSALRRKLAQQLKSSQATSSPAADPRRAFDPRNPRG